MRRIDVHHHVLPRAWIAEARAHKPDNTWGPNLLEWTPARAIEQMDAHDIAVAITALGLPGVWWAEAPEAIRLARLCNEYAAQMARDFPGRFGMFATLPIPHIDAALAEIAYAFDVLRADGVGMLTSYGDVWLGDPAFAAVYEELDRRDTVVHVHPTVPNRCVGLVPGISASTNEYLFDTARAITNVLHVRLAARYPRVRWIFSHGGGAFAPMVHRVLNLLSKNDDAIRAQLEAQLQTLYFDVCTATNPPSFGGVRNLTSFDRLLFGSDYPYVDVAETVDDLDRLDMDAEQRHAIESGNALALFPRYITEMPPSTIMTSPVTYDASSEASQRIG